ncbi:MAG: hypothetical protein QOD86_1507 [Miltoncostaeaceae bacterium]|jgi:hypothetical protein|nr:hypothetical protein [Miltoncostaeaceae bacterium]
MSEHGPNPGEILQLGLGFWASKTLLSAIELGVFTELGHGPEEYEALRGRLGLHERSARDFLDTLVALHMLERDGDRYANTPSTDIFLDRNKPSYIGGVLEMANHRLYGFWGTLTEGLLTGQPQNELKVGGGFFDTIYADPARLAQFLAGMTGISRGSALAIAAKFPWADHEVHFDLGTAQGDLPVQVALAHPHLANGGGMDLPPVAPHFEAYVAANGLSDRLRFHPGDFFADPLPPADVYTMGHILHDWPLDDRRVLLEKVHAVLPPGGALIVFEALIDDDRRENAFGLLMSLNMLIETPGGNDYTGADCQGWMRDAGFADTYVEHLAGPESMVVGIKAS